MINEIRISIPEDEVNYLIRAIRDRLHNIGKTYHRDGQSYHDDYDIAALCRVGRQLGYEISVTSNGDGFTIDSNRL